MPLPFIIGGIAAAVGLAGAGSAINGVVKMKDADDTMKLAKKKQETAVSKLEIKNESIVKLMDSLGEQELKILKTFKDYSNLMEKIQNAPKFKNYSKKSEDLPHYEPEELRRVAVGAGALLGGAGGAAAGTVGGIAAAGATTSAVMALGTASTGTAISTLSGVAATNATLAALGGGSLAAGGGGMALGSAVLGGATLGVGLLVGGIIFSVTGSHLSEKADEAYAQAKKTEDRVNKIVEYIDQLYQAATMFKISLTEIENEYRKRLSILDYLVNFSQITEWDDFSNKHKLMIENLALLVSLLYNMCQVNLVIKSNNKEEINQVNSPKIAQITNQATETLKEIDTISL